VSAAEHIPTTLANEQVHIETACIDCGGKIIERRPVRLAKRWGKRIRCHVCLWVHFRERTANRELEHLARALI
jgi:hypothetical protein